MKQSWVTMLSILVIMAVFGTACSQPKASSPSEEPEAESAVVIGGAEGTTSILVADQTEGDDNMGYRQITMEEARQIFEAGRDGSYVILDVRRADEYAEGHIPGAVNVANESIGAEEIPELPDRDQVIYVYCRSGRRSKEAAARLAALGYTNIVEVGGILDWTGETERE